MILRGHSITTGQDEWGRGSKMSFFGPPSDQGIKTVHAGGGGGGMAKFVHVVVECPFSV